LYAAVKLTETVNASKSHAVYLNVMRKPFTMRWKIASRGRATVMMITTVQTLNIIAAEV